MMPKEPPTPQEALILIDIQNDFCPQGALGVPHGDQILSLAQQWIDRFFDTPEHIITTQDAHPPKHISFREQGGPWPPHCVRGTPGFLLHPALTLPPGHPSFYKGFFEDRDAYSGFEGLLAPLSEDSPSLHQYLKQRSIRTLTLLGLATDYCVLATALDAIHYGYITRVVVDGVRGVNVHPDDSDKALATMQKEGVHLI